MDEQNCVSCNPVTQEQCQQYRESQDKRTTDNEIKTARNEGIMSVQTKLLFGIFAIGGASFFVDLFNVHIIIPK